MRGTKGRVRLVGAALAIGVLAVACSNAGASTGSGGDPSLSIASPAEGAMVSEPFTVQLDASVPIGDPSTGEHHVHLCFDGGSCDELSESVIAYEDSVEVTGLSPGTHTIVASLRNADHSDTGVRTEITVTVSGGDTSGGSGTTGSAGRGYGY
jgi:hypothetical protein